jgi:hypothetical protein
MDLKGDTLYEEGYQKSLELLEKASTKQGILASISEKDNYKRIWARDGIICGLAGLLSDSDKIINSFKATLNLLAFHQGPQGQISSNIKINEVGDVETVSYGGLAGRVDTVPLFIIGVTSFARLTNDFSFAEEKLPHLKRCLSLLDSWEFNNRGFVYVPRSGDWADEYILEGYVLYDQLLRLWALRCFLSLFDDESLKEKERFLSEAILINYWPNIDNIKSDKVYNKNAFETFVQNNNEQSYALAALTPSGYINRFDTLANALFILLNLAEDNKYNLILDYAQKIIINNPCRMVPAFWPPITEADAEWNQLNANYSYSFKNKAYHYHNGGVWPMVNGFWGMALVNASKTDEANSLLSSVIELVKKGKGKSGWGFYEYADSLDGAPGGTDQMAWSAAGLVLLKNSLEGKKLITN